MNLHEECLLKYLINPLDLFYSTEILKQNNFILENKINETNITMARTTNHTFNRI